MAVSLSSGVHPYVTQFTPEQITHSEENLQDIEIVLLDVVNSRKGENNINTIDKICVGLQKVEIGIRKFWGVKRCFAYLRKKKHNKIYLIMLKALAKDRMVALDKYVQVIFIFQFDSPNPWIKVVHASTDSQSSNPLITQLLYARHRLMHCDISFGITSRSSIEPSSQDFTEDSRLFIQYQVLMEVLLLIRFTKESEKDFIDWSLENYSENPQDKQAIELFPSEFKPGQAIARYTCVSFVYRILSRTFATDDIRLIYKIRYFICHLYRELLELHEKTIAFLDPRIHVYRGKRMSRNDFNKLKKTIKKLVITKCFLSASLDIQVALAFSGEELVSSGDVAVIFCLIINKNKNKSKPFAFIGDKSTMENEDEFLLPPGMIFENREIKKIKKNLYEVTWTHTAKEDRLEGEINRSKANFISKAENIESADEFTLLMIDASHSLNEQAIPQQSEDQVDEQVIPQQSEDQIDEYAIPQQSGDQVDEQPIQLIELPTAPMTQQLNRRIDQVASSTIRPLIAASKHLWRELYELRSQNANNGTLGIFIVDKTPFDEDESTDASPSNVIIGRIFPQSNIYNQRAYQIEIALPPSYPFKPPIVRVLTPIYHPNIDRNGIVCVHILSSSGSWTPLVSLTSVIKAVVDVIDHPDIDAVGNIDAAHEYAENRPEFERKASRIANEHGLPRN